MKYLYLASFIVLLLSFLLILIRLIRGPDGVDRIMSIDMLTTLLSVFISLFVLSSEQIIFVDTIVLLALVSFFGTVMYGRYLEKRIQNGKFS